MIDLGTRLVSKKTKKRIEGLLGLGKVVVEKNPIAHAVLTAKETADSTHKLFYGTDPKYLPKRVTRFTRSNPRRYSARSKSKVYVTRNRDLERLLEEDPLKRMYRQTRDPELRRQLKRLMA